MIDIHERHATVMEYLSVLLIAVGLAMDAFAVAICKGLAMRKPGLKAILVIGLWFGFFQAVMPVIGYLLGSSFYSYISEYDHWIAFALLALIGVNMIREALSGEEEGVDDSIGFRMMLILAIATSIDALAVGISLAMTGDDIFQSAVMIGVVTFLISAAGVKMGSLVGDRFGSRAELLGGVILILIGLRILLDHLGIL